VKHFVQLTLVRVKDPAELQKQQERYGQRRPKPEEMETVMVDVCANQVFSICPALDGVSPPLVLSLVGVNGIGEFNVAESCERVRWLVLEVLDHDRA
jgi:hypothetical protein